MTARALRFLPAILVLASLPLQWSTRPARATRSPLEERLASTACDLPRDYLVRIRDGWRADRGPDVHIVPEEPDFVGAGLPHVGPWAYVQDVPMFWYGPGLIPAVGRVDRAVTLADVAPTQAALLQTPFIPVDGQPLREPIAGRGSPPRLLVTLVWDAAGQNVLRANDDAWPYLRSITERGVWYEHATVGSSPTSTAQIHATIGTGAYPRSHGIVGHRMRIGPRITTPWAAGPAYLDLPTLADLYDRRLDNAPLVGLVGTLSIHAGMLGHGSMWGGGDRDLAILRQSATGDTLGEETDRWNLPSSLAPYFRTEPYANDVPGFAQDVAAVDGSDGRLDGRWRDNEIAQLLEGFDTPARVAYQERVEEEVVVREGFGRDDVPDLLFVNHKMIDYVSHVWTMNSPEMADAVRAEDTALEHFVGFLDREVGRGRWAMLLTADHGAIPDPARSGAFQISTSRIASGIEATFNPDDDGARVVQLVQPTGIFLDERELQDNGHSPAEVAAWLLNMGEGQAAGPGVKVPPGRADQPAFEAAFPSSMIASLPCLRTGS